MVRATLFEVKTQLMCMRVQLCWPAKLFTSDTIGKVQLGHPTTYTQVHKTDCAPQCRAQIKLDVHRTHTPRCEVNALWRMHAVMQGWKEVGCED